MGKYGKIKMMNAWDPCRKVQVIIIIRSEQVENEVYVILTDFISAKVSKFPLKMQLQYCSANTCADLKRERSWSCAMCMQSPAQTESFELNVKMWMHLMHHWIDNLTFALYDFITWYDSAGVAAAAAIVIIREYAPQTRIPWITYKYICTFNTFDQHISDLGVRTANGCHCQHSNARCGERSERDVHWNIAPGCSAWNIQESSGDCHWEVANKMLYSVSVVHWPGHPDTNARIAIPCNVYSHRIRNGIALSTNRWLRSRGSSDFRKDARSLSHIVTIVYTITRI